MDKTSECIFKISCPEERVRMDVTINGVTTEDVSLPEAFDMLADACFEWKNLDANHHGHMFYAASLEVGMMCIRAAEKYMAEQNRQREGVKHIPPSFLPTNRRQTDMKWRVKYWRWINEQAGEWYRTGLMTKENAEKVAESFRQSHEQVEVYYDDDGK